VPGAHPIEPDLAEMAERHGTEMSVSDWHARLVCAARAACGGVAMVVSGTERR
jgi:hypothetical protein